MLMRVFSFKHPVSRLGLGMRSEWSPQVRQVSLRYILHCVQPTRVSCPVKSHNICSCSSTTRVFPRPPHSLFSRSGQGGREIDSGKEVGSSLLIQLLVIISSQFGAHNGTCYIFNSHLSLLHSERPLEKKEEAATLIAQLMHAE